MCNIKSFLTPEECKVVWDSGFKIKDPQLWWVRKLSYSVSSGYYEETTWEILTKKQMSEMTVEVGQAVDRIPAIGVSELLYFFRYEEINIMPTNGGKYKISIYGREDMGFESDQIIDALYNMFYEYIDILNLQN